MTARSLLAALLLGLSLLAVHSHNYVTPRVCKSDTKMNRKTVIITGANSGIGKETALDIAQRGARVIMACRNMEKSAKVRDEIINKSKNENVILRKLDLSSFKSVREFANEIKRTEPRVDVLIHNAGVGNLFSKYTTEEGLEITMGTNHYGPFLLTHLLIDLLRRSAPSRVVVVASFFYQFASIDLKNPNPINLQPVYAYCISKLANIYFTRELARRLEGTGVTANCLHPGVIDSDIWRDVPFPFNETLKLISKNFFMTPEQGAQTSIYLAVSDEVEGVNGKYFSECMESCLTRRAQNMDKAKKFWEISEKIVQLTPSDPHILG